MTCDIEKTIQIFNERKKKKNYSQVSVIPFCWSLADEASCLPHFQLSTSLFFMM